MVTSCLRVPLTDYPCIATLANSVILNMRCVSVLLYNPKCSLKWKLGSNLRITWFVHFGVRNRCVGCSWIFLHKIGECSSNRCFCRDCRLSKILTIGTYTRWAAVISPIQRQLVPRTPKHINLKIDWYVFLSFVCLMPTDGSFRKQHTIKRFNPWCFTLRIAWQSTASSDGQRDAEKWIRLWVTEKLQNLLTDYNY